MMSRDTEAAIRALNAWLDQHEDEIKDDDVDELLQQFLEEYNAGEYEQDKDQAYDLFDQAMEQENAQEAKKLLQQAIELNPDLLDAKTELVSLQYDDPIDRIHQWTNLLNEEKEKLKANGYFEEENQGEFWMIFETRPYMRTLYTLARQYLDMHSYTMAIGILQDLIELDENDHLGARFDLAGCYMMMEDAEDLDHLIDLYDASENVAMLFFEAITAYRVGNYHQARKYILELDDKIPEFENFVSGDLEEDDIDLQSGMYQPGTIEEVMFNMMPFIIVLENEPLILFMNQCLAKVDDSPLN